MKSVNKHQLGNTHEPLWWGAVYVTKWGWQPVAFWWWVLPSLIHFWQQSELDGSFEEEDAQRWQASAWANLISTGKWALMSKHVCIHGTDIQYSHVVIILLLVQQSVLMTAGLHSSGHSAIGCDTLGYGSNSYFAVVVAMTQVVTNRVIYQYSLNGNHELRTISRHLLKECWCDKDSHVCIFLHVCVLTSIQVIHIMIHLYQSPNIYLSIIHDYFFWSALFLLYLHFFNSA